MSDSSSSDGEDTWIQWFCGLPGHEMFCEVQRGYIEDGFNLYGLRHWVPRINDCLDIILDRVSQNEASHELMEATCALYGLIHARYVLTTAGLEAMYAKYTLQEFGNCPHYLCRGQSVVPLGVRDEPHIETVKLYCPKCQDVYVHPSHAAQRVDGAYIGTTFPHLFFMTYGTMVPEPPQNVFVPRVFGFRVHSSAASGASARGQGEQHQQRLQEHRRLRQPHLHLPPPPPSPHSPQQQHQQVSAAAAMARESRAGKAAAPAPAATVPAAEAAGPVPSEEAGKGTARVGGAEGEDKSRVVVHIKEEEKSWTRGIEGGVSGKETRMAAVAESSDRKNFSGKPGARGAGVKGGGACPGSNGAGNGFRTSSAVNGTANCAANGMAASASARRPVRGSGNGSCNAANGGVFPRGERGDAGAAAAGCHGKEEGQAKPADDNSAGAGGNGVLKGVDAARNGHAPATASVPGNGVPPQERGTKRFSEVELEATSPEILSGDVGAGEAGAVGGGRARGKAPRSRKHGSPAARRASPMGSAAHAAMAGESGGAGSSNRMGVVEAVPRCDFGREGGAQRYFETT